MRTAAAAGALLAALVANSAAAHHALAAKFDEAKPLSLAGVVTLVDWRNPHVHVFINVTKPDKSSENWAVELESTVLLKKSGWTRTTLARALRGLDLRARQFDADGRPAHHRRLCRLPRLARPPAVAARGLIARLRAP